MILVATVDDATSTPTHTSTVSLIKSGINPEPPFTEISARNSSKLSSELKEEGTILKILGTESKTIANENSLPDQTNYELVLSQNLKSNLVGGCHVITELSMKISVKEIGGLLELSQGDLQTGRRLSSSTTADAAESKISEIANEPPFPVFILSDRSLQSCCNDEPRSPPADTISHKVKQNAAGNDVSPGFGKRGIGSIASGKSSKVEMPSGQLSENLTVINLAELASCQEREDVLGSVVQNPGRPRNRRNTGSSLSTTPSPHQLLAVTPLAFTKNTPLFSSEPFDVKATKSPSSVKLFLSLNGEADDVHSFLPPSRVFTPHQKSISENPFPQKKRKNPRGRSTSFLPNHFQVNLSPQNTPIINQRSTGRSRDARMRKLCCNGKGKARDELTLQAENESQGSAIAALSLIRSASKHALNSNSQKHVFTLSESIAERREKKLDWERPKSKYSGFRDASSPYLIPSVHQIDHVKDDRLTSPSVDSDKENWSPQIHGSSLRASMPSSPPDNLPYTKKILGNQQLISSRTYSLEIPTNRKRKFVNMVPDVYEDIKISRVGDIENFMKARVSLNKHKDLGAIQGLLSLSQGHWL